ncbi:MAG: hypothetical protein ACFFDF_08075 [Candidatus Odinarchaeota archaeon]
MVSKEGIFLWDNVDLTLDFCLLEYNISNTYPNPIKVILVPFLANILNFIKKSGGMICYQ